MTSKERLCVCCGRYIPRRLIGTRMGPCHLKCWIRTGLWLGNG